MVEADRPQMTIQNSTEKLWLKKVYRHILIRFNTYCFSTATVLMQTCLNIMLYVHCLPCLSLLLLVFIIRGSAPVISVLTLFQKQIIYRLSFFQTNKWHTYITEQKIIRWRHFCDLQKAFDCVDHDLLLSKMNWYGISGKGFNLIQSYLKNRYQRVIISNKSKQYFSEWEPIRYGVPQGSILGPLLFILYEGWNFNSGNHLFTTDTK